MVRNEVDEFVSLARSAYLGGNRQVSPRERSRWRFTFKRLADEATPRAEDAGPAASALERLIDPRAKPTITTTSARTIRWQQRVSLCPMWRPYWGVDVGTPRVRAFAEFAAPQLIR
jgi:hypothetical protein